MSKKGHHRKTRDIKVGHKKTAYIRKIEGDIMKKKYFVLLLLTMTMMLPNQAFAEKLNVRRIFGANRYETAVEISKDLYEKADTVIIASGENFPDALAGGSLAVQIDSPEIISGMQ